MERRAGAECEGRRCAPAASRIGKKERTGHRNRLQGLLVAQGVRLKPRRDFLERLEKGVVMGGESPIRRSQSRVGAGIPASEIS